MNKSESIGKLATALVKFNNKVTSISKDAKNPQFRSEYVTLDTLIKETRPVLQEVGLSIMQFPLSKDSGEVGIQTLLLHESGEYLESEPLFMTPMKMQKGGQYEVDKGSQAAGSVISYLRRYSYQAILNLSTGEDDDGNSSTPKKDTTPTKPTTGISEAQYKRLLTIANTKKITQKGVVATILTDYNKADPMTLTKVEYDEIVKKIENIKLI